jgi:hypothetical protein
MSVVFGPHLGPKWRRTRSFRFSSGKNSHRYCRTDNHSRFQHKTLILLKVYCSILVTSQKIEGEEELVHITYQ